MRRAAKIDQNQTEIVKALRKVGCSVLSLAALGKGAPDLLLGYKGKNVLLEIKRPKGKLNDQQQEFRIMWRGDLCVVRSVDEALMVIGLSTRPVVVLGPSSVPVPFTLMIVVPKTTAVVPPC